MLKLIIFLLEIFGVNAYCFKKIYLLYFWINYCYKILMSNSFINLIYISNFNIKVNHIFLYLMPKKQQFSALPIKKTGQQNGKLGY
jgi:hypothetical protein